MDSTKTTAKGYLFPILKADKIVEYVCQIGVELTVDELKDPARHKEKMKKVWVALVRKAAPRYPPLARRVVCALRESCL